MFFGGFPMLLRINSCFQLPNSMSVHGCHSSQEVVESRCPRVFLSSGRQYIRMPKRPQICSYIISIHIFHIIAPMSIFFFLPRNFDHPLRPPTSWTKTSWLGFKLSKMRTKRAWSRQVMEVIFPSHNRKKPRFHLHGLSSQVEWCCLW